MAGGKLQEGILFRKKVAPPGFFTLVLLSATPGATTTEVADLLASLWSCYRGLKRGKLRDLPRSASVPRGNLHVLLGLGSRAFDLAAKPVNAAALPAAMATGFDAPDAFNGGGPVSSGAGISYESDVETNPADAAIALRFTADTPLAVERAVVETWKLLQDDQTRTNATPALAIQAVYAGAARDDGRSWIDFHDGPSNLLSSEREAVVTIPPPSPPANPTPDADAWTFGGTYLAFMRLYIDLAAWRALTVRRQEELVGRKKVSGLPLIDGTHTFPVNPADAGAPPHEADPAVLPTGVTLSLPIMNSHIQRANHHVQPASDPLNHRIYRQGYPFLEPQGAPPRFRVGLNFVSFQSAPVSLIGMLGQMSWLRNTNFGGLDGDPDVLISARAAGVFLIPPNGDGGRFPGDRALTGH